MDRIRLLILDDNKLLRTGFVDILKKHQKLEVEAGTGVEEKFDLEINRFNPHVILLNSALLNQNSLQVVQRVMKYFPEIKIIVMGFSISENEINQFRKAGVSGFILKDAVTPEFVKIITAVAQGEIELPLDNSDLLLSRLVSNANKKGNNNRRESVQINELELQLLKHLSEGLNDIEIGKILMISTKRVKTQIHNIKQKLYLFALLDPAPTD